MLSEQAFEYDPDGAHHNGALPAEIEDEEHQAHDQLVEEIVSGDDDQLERYLGGEVPSVEELERTLAHEVLDCIEFPVLCGSALTGVGVDRLADFICEIGPSPADRPVTVQAGDELVEIRADAAGQPLAYVLKTVADPFVGQLSVFKVLSGTIKSDDHLINTNSSTDERLHGLMSLRGKEQSPLTSIGAGDIGAVAKLANTGTGDTLAPKGTPVKVPAAPIPPAVLTIAIRPRTQADDDKLASALHRLQTEDLALVVDRTEDTRQTVLRGVGDTHLAVALERLSRKFGVNVDTEELRVPYRETVTGSAEAEGKIKKQSGGHGQYAVAMLRVSPRERGSGFEFVDSIVGGAIPRQYIPAVHKGVEEAMVAGGVHGFQVVDVKVECFDGKYHSVDSSEMAFKTAAASGLREAMSKASVAVLEPVSLLTVTVPAALPGRRARRHQRPSWPRPGHHRRRARRAADHRLRADGRDLALRDRPALDDRWPGPVHRRARPLRRVALAPGRQGEGDPGKLPRMTASAPADLAVAFRSLARRLKEALAPVDGDTSVAAPMLEELQSVVTKAAAVVRAEPSAGAVADAIERRPPDSWIDSELDALRREALDAGRLLRAIQTAAEEAAADAAG